MITFLEAGDDFILPENFPQEIHVVREQLEVLKSLQKHSGANTKQESQQVSENKPQSKEKATKETETSKPSTSNKNRTQLNQIRKEKSTVFVPNSNLKISGSCKMIEKFQSAAPYYIFFSNIPDSPEVAKGTNVITFSGKLFNTI